MIASRHVLPAAGPGRTLTYLVYVYTLGAGLWMAINVIYATTVIGLSPGQVGIGLGIAAGFRLALSAPMGYLADRCGPRSLLGWSFAALVPLTVLLLAVREFVAYVVVVSLHAVAFALYRASLGAMIAGTIPADDRVRVRAYLRVATNISASVGAAVAGLLLAVGTPTAYRWALVGNMLTCAAAGLITRALPAVAPQPARHGRRLAVLADRPFLAFILLDGVLSMHNVLLDVVLPLWIVQHTAVPRWSVAVLMIVNTVSVVLLQVGAARGTDHLMGAARAVRSAGLCIALACLAFSFTGGMSVVPASTLLLAGAVSHVLGEVRQAAGGWGISFALAPSHAHGQYQGAYAMGFDLGRILGAGLLVWLVLGHGMVGWQITAAMFAAAGLAVPPVVAWARKTQMTTTV